MMTDNPVSEEFSPILEVLKDHPLGMSIKEISAAVSMSRNSVAKYLDVLTASGQLELRHVGNAKLYSLSFRVPVGDLMNHARELIIVLDNDLRVIQASGSFCRFTGISREQILHARLSSLPMPLLSAAEEHELVALLSGGSTWKKEIRVTRNGTEVWFDSRFIPTVLENGVPGITLILEDSTERRLAKKASIERDRLLHTIFQIPTTPQFFIDRNHKVVYWDRALEILTGIKAEEVVGTSNHWRAFYTHPHPCLADFLVDGNPGAAIALQYPGKCPAPAGMEGKYEYTDFFPDMVTGAKWLHITSSLIRDTSGTVTGAMETIENVSDRNKGNFIVQK
jgi:PAS domain S-box-containing protein